MLKRNFAKNPVPYSYKVRNQPELKGVIRSREEFFSVLEAASKLYRTDDITVALRRMGKGVCPKSFPISLESLYFSELYDLTHGGEYGNDLVNLPLAGGVLDQPNVFFAASDIIRRVRSKHQAEKLDAHKNQVSVPSDTGNSNAGKQGRIAQGDV